MCDLAFQPLRQSSYHVVIRACRYGSYWPIALLPAPFDGEDGRRLNCVSDWALAPLHTKGNADAETLGNLHKRRYFKPLSANALGQREPHRRPPAKPQPFWMLRPSLAWSVK